MAPDTSASIARCSKPRAGSLSGSAQLDQRRPPAGREQRLVARHQARHQFPTGIRPRATTHRPRRREPRQLLARHRRPPRIELALAQSCEDVAQERLRLRRIQPRRRRFDAEEIPPERAHLEPVLFQERELVGQQRRRDRVELHRHRKQETLAERRTVAELPLQLLEQHALQRRTPVEQHHARRRLEDLALAGQRRAEVSPPRQRAGPALAGNRIGDGRDGRLGCSRKDRRDRRHRPRERLGGKRLRHRRRKRCRWLRQRDRRQRRLGQRTVSARRRHRRTHRAGQRLQRRHALRAGRERGGEIARGLAQRVEQRAHDERPHAGIVAEPHLAFRRMHVHVDRRRFDLEEEERQRIPALRQVLLVALDQRVRQRLRVDRTPVHERDHLVARAAAGTGFADQAGEPHPLARRLDGQQRLGGLASEDRGDTLQQRAARRRLEDRAPVLDERERHLRVRERVEPHALDDVRRLGRVALEELPPRRHRMEEVRHRDARAGRHAAVAHVHELAAVDEDLRARLRRGRTRPQLETGNAGDGRHRLAAETEGMQRIEVGRLRDLARGVALEGEQRVVAVHALAVVLDAHQRPPAMRELDRHARGAGIEAVLDQLAHDRSRTFHHLASGDLVGHAVGQDADGRHAGTETGTDGEMWNSGNQERKVGREDRN